MRSSGGGFQVRAWQEGPEAWVGEVHVGSCLLFSLRGFVAQDSALDGAEAEIRRRIVARANAEGPITRPMGEVRIVAICQPFGRDVRVADWVPIGEAESLTRARFSSFVRFEAAS